MTAALLVVAADAGFRATLFERLSAAGYRVDAVADRYHGSRRLFKDVDALLIVEQGLDPPVTDLDALTVTPADLQPSGALENRIASRLDSLDA